MDVKEVLRLADRLVFAKTGKHLDDLQEAILRGAWQGQKYSKIAADYQCTEGHVRDVGSELWKILSEVLGEVVSKSNFRATVERLRFSNISHFGKDIVHIGNVNVCAETVQSPKVPPLPRQEQTSREDNTIKVRQDVGEAPDVFPFYGRTEELTKLEKWIVQERCRLVALLGISGIGKTALAVHLVEQIQDKFEYVIWRSLRASPLLEVIQRHLIQFLSSQHPPNPPLVRGGESGLAPVSADAGLSLLIEYLRKYRCLVVFDDVHMVFSSGQLAGNYQPGYEDYGELFRRVGEFSHNSCLVLTSWDKPREIAALEGENRPVRSLHLDGLGETAREILREKGLAEEEKWQELINPYGGNPLWLSLVATMIQDLFSGSVSEYLAYDTLFLSEDLKHTLHQQFNRLSEAEKKVMSALASEAEPVSLSKMPENLQLSQAELLDVMQSLGRRSLIEKTKQGNSTLFTLQPVIRQYLTSKK